MYKTSDLSIAAYLMMKGMKLLNAYRTSNGQFMFEFDDPSSDGPSDWLDQHLAATR